MNAWAVLGIGRGADAAQIKRAYARAIKVHRPDVDPAAFQRCTDAYHACLEYARRAALVATADDDDEDEEESFELPDQDAGSDDAQADVADETVVVDAVPRPEAPPPRRFERAVATNPADAEAAPHVDHDADRRGFERFMEELVARSRRDLPSALVLWLRSVEIFYSLEAKANAPTVIVPALCQLEPPLPGESIDVILEFFHLDDVNQSRHGLAQALVMLREDAVAARQFEKTLKWARSQSVLDNLLLKEMIGPRHWVRRLAIALVPILPTRLYNTYLALASHGRRYVDRRLDSDAIGFWRHATARDRFAWQRLAVVFLRLAVFGGGLALLNPASPEVGAYLASTFGGLWAVHAAVAYVRAKLQAWQARHPYHDLASYLLPCAGLLGGGLVVASSYSVLAGWAAAAVYFGAVWSACKLVGSGDPRWSAVASVVIGPVFGMVALLALLGGLPPVLHGLALGLAIALAAIPAVDQLEAKIRKVRVNDVRRRGGWLWGLPALLIAATAFTASLL